MNSATLKAALILVALSHGAWAQGMPGMGATGPTEVGVMALTTADVPYKVTLPGRAVASEETEIRPRVEGLVEEIVYKSGRPVAVGDVLFRLDAATYEAELASAEAGRDSAQAALATAQAAYNRASKLEGVGISTSDLETARATLAQAEADLKSAEAELQKAQLDLDRVDLKSPIAGIPDVPAVSVGSLVTANQTDPLTTITRLDPIFVDVTESSTRRMRIREEIDSGAMSPGTELDVTLTLENGVVSSEKGTLITPGVNVSTTTGSIDMRFKFDNPHRMILPGQFLRVEVTLGTSKAILVPQRAATRQADGTLTAFIAQDGTAHEVQLTYSGTYQNAWVVTEGVAEGDLILLDGLTNLADGAEITTVPVTINAQGVVEDAATTGIDAVGAPADQADQSSAESE